MPRLGGKNTLAFYRRFDIPPTPVNTYQSVISGSAEARLERILKSYGRNLEEIKTRISTENSKPVILSTDGGITFLKWRYAGRRRAIATISYSEREQTIRGRGEEEFPIYLS